ncbi:MAG: NfuA family Fe-S biogenesis protein [Xanthomonadales bacterium]|nr:NfuA family Fe-S biogenesis protein [Xanthomonadales bacterium]
MISISPRAEAYFRKLVEQQGLPGLGIRMRAVHAGTARGECQLEFCEPGERAHGDHKIACEGFPLFVSADSTEALDGAEVDFVSSQVGGELTVRAPRLRPAAPAVDAGLAERVLHVIESEINPQLASHGGRVSLVEMTAGGEAVLRFGGGCHGCGMVDVTLRDGVERTLRSRVPQMSGVIDATDHSTGASPYYR